MKKHQMAPSMWRYPWCVALNVLGGMAVIAALCLQDRVDLYVLCALLAFAFLMGNTLLYKHYAQKARREIPITVVRAQVASTRKAIERQYIGSMRKTVECYYTTFQPEGGEPIEFRTSEAEQRRYPAGTWGTLRYQGWQYLSFMERDIFLNDEDLA